MRAIMIVSWAVFHLKWAFFSPSHINLGVFLLPLCAYRSIAYQVDLLSAPLRICIMHACVVYMHTAYVQRSR